MSLPLNSVPNNPSLSDLLDLLKKEIFLGLTSHHIGTVQSFNPGTQTVTATVNYTKTFFQLNKTTNQYVPTQVNYPTLIDCPVVILGGGLSAMTFPIQSGDECLLIFNDRDFSTWFKSGSSTNAVPTNRLHSFSDAIALVGVRSTPNAIKAYDSVRALLTNGNASIGINPEENLITIKNQLAGTFGLLMQQLCTSVAVPGVPIAPGVATQLELLLE